MASSRKLSGISRRVGWTAGVAAFLTGGVMMAADAPKAIEPVPSARQIAWQEDELTMFVHFGMNTFTGRSTGEGNEDPKTFNPTELDCKQWVTAAKEAGFKGMILTAKHHDGFCLWQTETTPHSVKNSGWREGKGDVVREFADACKENGMKMGIYCSPWDRNQQTFAEGKIYDNDKPAYARLYQKQLTELLSNYGPVYEMWFDGNKAEVATWPDVIKTVRKLQPGAIIKQGPRVYPVEEDARWVGNEQAMAPTENWSVYPEPEIAATKTTTAQKTRIWFPLEADTMMIGSWFWDGKPPKSLDVLLNFYYTSVGRNSILMLNVAPDKRGKFSDESVARLHEFSAALKQIFGTDFATGATATASNVRGGDGAFGAANTIDGKKETYWATDDGVTTGSIEYTLAKPAEFNVIRLEEEIRLGQRVGGYKVEAAGADGAWKTISEGTTIGYRKLDRIPRTTATKVRVTITKALASPVIRGFGLHLDNISPAAAFEAKNANAEPTKRAR